MKKYMNGIVFYDLTRDKVHLFKLFVAGGEEN
jgi:hypothetical protein